VLERHWDGFELVHPPWPSVERSPEILPPYKRLAPGSACVLTGKPNVYGSIFRFEGQVSVFWGAKGPCYRCLFPEPPPPGLVPSCAEGGVLGVLPGIIGCLQANEAIKLIVGIGEPMIGRLLLFDALRMRFRELKLKKDPECPICSEHPTQTELIDYVEFCGLPPVGQELEPDPEIDVTVHQLDAWLRAGDHVTLIDVRTDQEREIARIDGARHIPVAQLERRLAELDQDERIVIHCHKGPRSTRATHLLRSRRVSVSAEARARVGTDDSGYGSPPMLPPVASGSRCGAQAAQRCMNSAATPVRTHRCSPLNEGLASTAQAGQSDAPQCMHLEAASGTEPMHLGHLRRLSGPTAMMSQPMGPSRKPKKSPAPRRPLFRPIAAPIRGPRINHIQSQ
jgi:rhodanese-related sulfurtransferase